MRGVIALCLEDLQRGSFLRCTALGAGQPGLTLDGQGQVRWRADEPGACSIVVDEETRLVLCRTASDATVGLQRGGRGLTPALGETVPLLQDDELAVGPRRFRVHVHGPAQHPEAPTPVPAAEVRPQPVETLEVRPAPPIAPPEVLERAARRPPEPPAAAPARSSIWLWLAILAVLLVALLSDWNAVRN